MTPKERELKGELYKLQKENKRLLADNLRLIRMAAFYQLEALGYEAKTLPGRTDTKH
jgi:hypothetical protein